MHQPSVINQISELRKHLSNIRRQSKTIALVPTMGALHQGHLSLIQTAHQHADCVVASIFVNPTQFGVGEDFDSYPRTEQEDIEKLASEGVDCIFIPSAKEMYPTGFCSSVDLQGPARELETSHRPHFFSGVATVVTKLLLSVMPDTAIFGEKDYQQLQVIKQFTRDLNIPVKIIGAPTLRETDGLAMSSRNAYLSPAERKIAAQLYAQLVNCEADLSKNQSWQEVQRKAITNLTQIGFEVDYLELRDSQTLNLPIIGNQRRLLVAAKLGKTRLIDNIHIPAAS
nr:pantoate--beta-alanine ligase [Pseudovibrio stylochi]